MKPSVTVLPWTLYFGIKKNAQWYMEAQHNNCSNYKPVWRLTTNNSIRYENSIPLKLFEDDNPVDLVIFSDEYIYRASLGNNDNFPDFDMTFDMNLSIAR